MNKMLNNASKFKNKSKEDKSSICIRKKVISDV